LSEPKNYHNSQEPSDTTVLCAELPCSEVEPEWRMSEEELCDLVLCSLEKVGIPIKAPIQAVIVRRLTHAYPIYQLDYDVHWQKIDSWLADFTNLLTFGRLGLFAHDNTHHALYMAYAAVQCLNQRGEFDNSAWQKFRKIFDSHVVED
jgi:protoporphyrinogen oxidase